MKTSLAKMRIMLMRRFIRFWHILHWQAALTSLLIVAVFAACIHVNKVNQLVAGQKTWTNKPDPDQTAFEEAARSGYSMLKAVCYSDMHL